MYSWFYAKEHKVSSPPPPPNEPPLNINGDLLERMKLIYEVNHLFCFEEYKRFLFALSVEYIKLMTVSCAKRGDEQVMFQMKYLWKGEHLEKALSNVRKSDRFQLLHEMFDPRCLEFEEIEELLKRLHKHFSTKDILCLSNGCITDKDHRKIPVLILYW